MNSTLKKYIEIFVPDKLYLPLVFFYNKFLGKHEYELFIIEKFFNKKRTFIDIGANRGIYSYYFSNIFDSVETFEPISEITFHLSSLKKSNIRIHNVGLSNKNYSDTLYIPIENNNLLTPLASLNKIGDFNSIERKIPIRTLDSYNFRDVDFIKIDVEGNELNVIEGAKEIIKKFKPVLLIEIEQRHIKTKMESIFDFILKLGYEGCFYNEKKFFSISEFDYTIHQEKFLKDPDNKNYINNFIFFSD